MKLIKLLVCVSMCVTGCAADAGDRVKLPMPMSDAGASLDCAAMYGPGCSNIVGENGYPACECVTAMPPPAPVEAELPATTCFADMGGGLGTGYALHCGIASSAFTIAWADGSCDATHTDTCLVGTTCTVTGPGVDLIGVCE